MRLFIAFPISQEVKNELERVVDELKFNKIKWVPSEQWHITVVFLGDVETQNFASLHETIENVCKKYKPMNFKLEKVDGFPDIHNPNVIVVKAIDESGLASQLQKELSDALRQLGIQIDNKPWKPHITIGRNKIHPVKPTFGRATLSFGQRWQFDWVKVGPIEWTVSEVILFESELLPSGPRYTKLFSCNLI